MKYLVFFSAIAILSSGCVMKQKIMDVAVVSMTHPYLPEGAKLDTLGPVSGEFCVDTMHDKGSIGLFDEAIKNAQSQSGADFISNASFFTTGPRCVLLEGTGEKIVSNASGAPLR